MSRIHKASHAPRPAGFVLATLLSAALLFGVPAQANGAANSSSDWPYDDAVVPPTGGAVALPGNEVFVSVAPGTVEKPIRMRIEKVKPEDAPGPITEGVTVIKGVRISLPGYDYTQPYAGNFKGRPLEVRFKAEGFVEEPNLFGDYYTAVCFWDDFEGRGDVWKAAMGLQLRGRVGNRRV